MNIEAELNKIFNEDKVKKTLTILESQKISKEIINTILQNEDEYISNDGIIKTEKIKETLCKLAPQLHNFQQDLNEIVMYIKLMMNPHHKNKNKNCLFARLSSVPELKKTRIDVNKIGLDYEDNYNYQD